MKLGMYAIYSTVQIVSSRRIFPFSFNTDAHAEMILLSAYW